MDGAPSWRIWKWFEIRLPTTMVFRLSVSAVFGNKLPFPFFVRIKEINMGLLAKNQDNEHVGWKIRFYSTTYSRRDYRGGGFYCLFQSCPGARCDGLFI